MSARRRGLGGDERYAEDVGLSWARALGPLGQLSWVWGSAGLCVHQSVVEE